MEADLVVDAPPTWVFHLLDGGMSVEPPGGHRAVRTLRGVHASLLTATVSEAVGLSEAAFRDAVAAAYDAIAVGLGTEARHPVRFWNFIPSPHTIMSTGADRYMVFNSGRYLAFSRRFGDASAFACAVPAASGVGSRSPDLTIHCLATDEPGTAVEHARQIPAYRYSTRYGLHPPSFSRATLMRLGEDQRRLLVAGTAAVRGEDSMHAGQLEEQIEETLENLASVVQAANAASGSNTSGNGTWLDRFEELRVYLPRPTDADRVLASIRPWFPRVSQIEVVQAELCRQELLVEIEGVVRMD